MQTTSPKGILEALASLTLAQQLLLVAAAATWLIGGNYLMARRYKSEGAHWWRYILPLLAERKELEPKESRRLSVLSSLVFVLAVLFGVLAILSGQKKPNQALEPTSTAVTPPADAGDRASGTRGSP